MKRLIAVVVVAALLGGLGVSVAAAVGPSSDAVVDAPTATGTPRYDLMGATRQGTDAAVTALSSCPSVRDQAMPPCTQAAGNSGYYAAAAYVCVAGLGWYKNMQYPSLRTCMDGYLVLSGPDLPSTSRQFYIVDLYKWWRAGAEVIGFIWEMAAVYVPVIRYFGWVNGWIVCPIVIAGTGLSGFPAALAGQACGLSIFLVQLEQGG